jgi:hypothetical protein
MTSLLAAPGVPVAVKVTGDPASPEAVAVSAFAPAVVPRVHAGDVAIPESSVVTTPEVASDPPPLATAKVTDVPGVALPAESVTFTDGAMATAVLTVADCALPALVAMLAAAPGPVGVRAAEVADVSPELAKVRV